MADNTKGIGKVGTRRYGDQRQIVEAIEALGRLAKELCMALCGSLDGKFVNNTTAKERTVGMITEDMADVEIALRQLKLVFENAEPVSKSIERKDREMLS